jgi:hypothetical protein
MPNSLTPRDISQVAIQPVASPVSLNILPAPGQMLVGNSLQQLGQALSSFSPALEGMLARRVAEDKQYMAAQGAAVDFSQADLNVDPNAPLAERQAALNREFKKAVEANGAPDSANPFFLIAARQNFGRAVGLQYRNALASLSNEATDPDNPVPFAEIAKKAASMVGMDAVTGDVYGASGFAGVAQEANAEYSFRFQQETRKRQDYLAVERAQNGMADALLSAASDEHGFDAAKFQETTVGRAMQQTIDSMQLTSTDPETTRKAVVGAFQVALGRADDETQVETMMTALSEMNFGKAKVRENPALFSSLLALKDNKLNDIAAKATREERMFQRDVARNVREAYALGFVEQVSNAVLTGRPEEAQSALEGVMDKIINANPKLAPDVRNALRSSLMKDLDALSKNAAYQRNAQTEADYTSGFDLISDGSIEDEVVLRQWIKDKRLDVRQGAGLLDFFHRQVGVVRSATAVYANSKGKENVSRIERAMMLNGLGTTGPDGSGLVLPEHYRDMAQNYEASWREEAYKRVQDYVRGDFVDPTSKKSYKDIQLESGAEAAKATIPGVLDGFYDAKIKSLGEELKAQKSALDAGLPSGLSVSGAPSGFMAAVAAQQRSRAVDVAKLMETSGENVDAQSEAMKSGLEQEYAELKAIHQEVGYGDGRSFNPEAVVERLGAMFDLASTKPSGTVETTYQRNWWWDKSVSFTKDTMLQKYGQVKRSVALGLDPYEVIHNQTREGLPVFGVVLPKREDAGDYYYSTLMFQSQDQLRDPETVNDLLNALSIPNDLRPGFIARQATLLRLRDYMKTQVTDGIQSSIK